LKIDEGDSTIYGVLVELDDAGLKLIPKVGRGKPILDILKLSYEEKCPIETENSQYGNKSMSMPVH